MSKTRSDSKLAPHEDFIFERLVDGNASYQTVADALREELGVQTSASALSTYFAKHSWRWRAERAAVQAEEIEKQLLKDPKRFSKAKAAAIAQREFELSASKLSVGELMKLRILSQKDNEISIKQQALELRIREFEQKAEAIKKTLERAKSKGSIDKKTIAEIEEKLGIL